MEHQRLIWMKTTLLVSSLVFLAFLLMAAFQENFTAEWRVHQTAYAQALNANASEIGQGPVSYSLEMRQLYLASLNRTDRCVTCHVGIDNPAFKDAPLPLAAHPGELLKLHPADKFGCTICHQGQGRATDRQSAHANVIDERGHNPSFWEEPLLPRNLIYTSCGRCHYETDLYGGQSDLYGQVRAIQQISTGELNAGLPGAENIARGKNLVVDRGCLGCHKYRGRGGVLGPDITYVGNKTVHNLDFHHIPEGTSRTVEGWLYAHFKSPQAVIPNSLMPELDLSNAQAADLTAYMISLKRKSAPAAYTPLPQPVDPAPVRGETLYRMYCSACHGAEGVGAIVRDAESAKLLDRPRELLTPSLRNTDTLAVASDAYLKQVIAGGRPGTSMPAWQADGGLSEDEIDLITAYIRRWEPNEADRSFVSASRGDARVGGALFRANCTGCHGSNAEGGQIGISLRAASFLAIASDELLAETILRGRPNTAMPSWRQFDNRDVSDLLAYLRSFQPLQSNRESVLALLNSDRRVPDGTELTATSAQSYDSPSAAIGLTLYRSRCTVCHGEAGEGKIGPSINNQAMLRVVSNEFLHDTLVRGRPGTAMPAWRQLSSEDVVDLIALLRSWQTGPAKELPAVRISGDPQNGQLLYQGICASCHGPNAEGALGPQLANSVFLETVHDETLIEWISYGRQGTQMRPHLRGQQGNADLTHSQIEDIVTYLRSTRGRQPIDGERIGLGYAPRGAVLYRQMCISCHGEHGEGTIGPAIRNRAFLSAASDGFLRATVVLGRDDTEMRSMGHRGTGIVEMQAEEIDDLIAYLRSSEDIAPISHRFVMGVNPDNGREKYAAFCAGCHGDLGRGGFAPELNNSGFLSAATDGYLQATIIRGRRGTAMRPFGLSGHGLAHLSQGEINEIVAYIRQWSPDVRPLRRTEAMAKDAGSQDH
ncbi:MAG: c-type cytochrome [Planctomycetales bacterium]